MDGGRAGSLYVLITSLTLALNTSLTVWLGCGAEASKASRSEAAQPNSFRTTISGHPNAAIVLLV